MHNENGVFDLQPALNRPPFAPGTDGTTGRGDLQALECSPEI